jgi:hypothetical protein
MEGASLFLRQHGTKLLSLETKSTDVFESCPALNLLIVTVRASILCSAVHSSLHYCSMPLIAILSVPLNIQTSPRSLLRSMYRGYLRLRV